MYPQHLELAWHTQLTCQNCWSIELFRWLSTSFTVSPGRKRREKYQKGGCDQQPPMLLGSQIRTEKFPSGVATAWASRPEGEQLQRSWMSYGATESGKGSEEMESFSVLSELSSLQSRVSCVISLLSRFLPHPTSNPLLTLSVTSHSFPRPPCLSPLLASLLRPPL